MICVKFTVFCDLRPSQVLVLQTCVDLRVRLARALVDTIHSFTCYAATYQHYFLVFIFNGIPVPVVNPILFHSGNVFNELYTQST